MIQKKLKIYIKIWLAVDRDSGNVIAYDISINENKNEDIVCRRLLNKVLFNNNIDSYNYKPIPNTKINIIASDGNYQYHKIIKCKERKIVKVYKDKKTKRLLRDKEGNIK